MSPCQKEGFPAALAIGTVSVGILAPLAVEKGNSVVLENSIALRLQPLQDSIEPPFPIVLVGPDGHGDPEIQPHVRLFIE